jgi:hypothetical protein
LKREAKRHVSRHSGPKAEALEEAIDEM